jgi:hypothetical protein
MYFCRPWISLAAEKQKYEYFEQYCIYAMDMHEYVIHVTRISLAGSMYKNDETGEIEIKPSENIFDSTWREIKSFERVCVTQGPSSFYHHQLHL